MRRRRRTEGEAPSDLLVFHGVQYPSATEWVAAFEEFRAAREAWNQANPGATLAPYDVNGYCPFDADRFRKTTAS
ncbi:hypothetical protein [Mycobacteroides abscessus]|uniref:hypothetical protein n=1 Tax=Mycobacteroides abscessus TaxID=36809 RepID=UPI000258563F|nr:hypothetical protein [Mycobacteroides abscessus]EIC63012.1 hypothetical protein OUW_17551 [Mycobacteroides abscessus M93]